ncbi:GDP-mannose 4,6-dehydratase, partial [Bacteroides fragilis]
MKILVTGGAGFIGSHLCDLLVCNDNQVVALDNLSRGRKENIMHLVDDGHFSFIQEDLLNRSSLRQIFIQEDFDMVYHLAANSDIQKGSQDPTVDYDLTFNTTFNVLQ